MGRGLFFGTAPSPFLFTSGTYGIWKFLSPRSPLVTYTLMKGIRSKTIGQWTHRPAGSRLRRHLPASLPYDNDLRRPDNGFCNLIDFGPALTYNNVR